ncbi:Subtilisin inhibitor-like [Allokutzneria albata]|uniref:Subtilisin inhibitor-like n=1 Tax=Allokutzneria albata TaxID=211114 RepID=A0A1H0BKV9_ALLAB|nr:Subtilisin inhibitor-like [Allokutzneria albata]
MSCAALSGAALLASVTTASATPAPVELVAPSALTLTVTHDGITSEAPKVALLNCSLPAVSTHPKTADACRDLQLAQGDFAKLNPSGRRAACTMEYDPFEVTATGTWRGKPVTHKATYANPCVLAASTGAVYRF